MLLSERRKRYRQVLEGNVCMHPASVFDAMSARMAESLGFEIGMFAGSIGSGTVLGAPDLVVLTLTEFAEQIRRITRGSDLPLMVDADHGYGNALNVMRTVEELETSGVAALTIEDTVLPIPFGGQGEGLISTEEMLGKLRGAVAARQDPSLVILGRTSALRRGGIAETEKRLKAYQETGIDGIFLAGASTRAEVEAMHRATSLPLLLGGGHPGAVRPQLPGRQRGAYRAAGASPLLRLDQGSVRHAQISQRRRGALWPQRPGGVRRAAECCPETERLQALAEQLLALEPR